MIRIDQITTFDRVRQSDRKHVEALAESIREVGLLNPVTVVMSGGGYALVAGMHRLEACRSLGWSEVPANVVDLDEHRRVIAECDENLCAPALTASEKAEFTRRRKLAYEALHPETAKGENQHTRVRQVGEGSPAERFTADTAAKTGKSERAVQRDAERGEKIAPAALEAVRGTKLDKGVYLDALKHLPAEEQVAKIEADLTTPVKAAAAPEAVPDPIRKELSKLTREALEDDVVGLRADLEEEMAKRQAAEARAEELEGWWRTATEGSDIGRALGAAKRQCDVLNGRLSELQKDLKRMERRLKATEAERDAARREIENTLIPLGPQ